MGASKPIVVCLLLLAVAASGCTSKGGGPSANGPSHGDVAAIKATSTTGGVHGFVVDQKIVPVKGATVSVTPGNKNTTTDAGGAFVIDGLAAGTYLVKATHPLYDTQQQTVEVQAGVIDPPDVKFQLVRLISATPYVQTLKYEGFIACSLNTPVLLSEECGEGVGSPKTSCDEGLPPPCVANPVFPGQRVGHQGNNYIQFNFQPDVGFSTMAFEQVWDATSDAGGELYTPVGTSWACTPNCSWKEVTSLQGASPTYTFADAKVLEAGNVTAGNNVTMFTWAGSFDNPAGVALSQRFTDFVTISYYLPLPEGWSFVKGDPAPF